MIDRHKFDYRCEECGEPLLHNPEPGDFITGGVWIGLDFEGSGELKAMGVKYWRCAECGETTWVSGFPITEDL